jgi:sodium/calcium exchanger protein
MLNGIELDSLNTGPVLLVIGAILLIGAALTGIGDDNPNNPGLRAFFCWIPIAAGAIAATVSHHAEAAICIIFCTSVAALSLIQGFVVLIAPRDGAPTAYRRIWPFVIPVVLMTLLAGFAAKLTWIYALMFLCEGGALFLCWNEVGGKMRPSGSLAKKLNGVLWVVVAVIGGVGATKGTMGVAASLQYPESNMVILAILGPLLALPLIVSCSSLAQGQFAWSATSTLVGVVMLNLCLLLPLVILLRYPVETYGQNVAAMAQVPPLVFPLVTWRVDNVILLLLAFILLPAALERWRLGRAEGLTLLGFYVVYLLMEVVAVLKV